MVSFDNFIEDLENLKSNIIRLEKEDEHIKFALATTITLATPGEISRTKMIAAFEKVIREKIGYEIPTKVGSYYEIYTKKAAFEVFQNLLASHLLAVQAKLVKCQRLKSQKTYLPRILANLRAMEVPDDELSEKTFKEDIVKYEARLNDVNKEMQDILTKWNTDKLI
uniref:Uncharacterized protein n=1 Tax=Ditylenchus dipsaci TaxID=166011 RepID=A0A915EJN7_9BILA